MSENKIEQPDLELRALLDNILHAEKEEIMFMGKTYRMGWLHFEQERKFTHVMMTEKNIEKRNAKLCACLLLCGCWKMFFCYWWLWRKLYYINSVDAIETLRLLDMSKKKIPSSAYSLITILATAMTDVMMATRKEEASATPAGQVGAPVTR